MSGYTVSEDDNSSYHAKIRKKLEGQKKI